MILPFKTMIDGKPTFFMEKIWAGLEDICEKENYCIDAFHFGLIKNGFDDSLDRKPKIHTIREDKNNRWKEGKTIDFFINSRTKDMFRFAPRIPVISCQSIIISNSCNGFQVSVDGINLWNFQIEELALNDGFEGIKEFRDYFIAQLENNFFIGKIIHWTNFKY